MVRQFFYQYLTESHNDLGRILAIFKLEGKAGRKRRVPEMDKRVLYFYSVLRILGMIAVRAGYVLLFMGLPAKLLNGKFGDSAFPILGTIVYLSVILSFVCGSLVNSELFDMDESAFGLLTTMRMEPACFFRNRLVFKLVTDGIGFMAGYLLSGLLVSHSFYLVIWLLVSRTIGEAINLSVFRVNGKSIGEINGLPVAIMTASVFMSYGFVYLRGHVVDLTPYIYNYLWLFVGLVVGAIILYWLFVYGGYPYVARSFVGRMKKHIGDEKREYEEELELLAGEYEDSPDFKSYDKDDSKGIGYIHKVFFARNQAYFRNSFFVRGIILLFVAVAGSIICLMSGERTREIIWQAICAGLPLMVFITFCMSTTPAVCRAFFFHMDKSTFLSKAPGSVPSSTFFRCFMVRLRSAVRMDLLIGVMLCAALGIIGCATGNEPWELAPVFAGVLMLSVFFSIYFLTVYYIFQPYNSQMKVRNRAYLFANFCMLLITYGCVYVNVEPMVFVLLIGIVLALAISLGSTLVYKLSGRTFKLYGK